MTASTALVLLDVVNALQTLSVEQTKFLCFKLGVGLHTLDDITRQYHGNDCKTHLLQSWLDKDTTASWKKIVSVLKKVDMDVFAQEVFTQYCPVPDSPSSDPSSSVNGHAMQAPASGVVQFSVTTESSTVASAPCPSLQICATHPSACNNDRVEAVKAAIVNFEEKFLNLMSDTRSVICGKERQDPRFLDKFRDTLLLLPVAKKSTHVKFFHEYEDEILEARSIRKLFAILCRHWNYTNYEILLHLVKKFCDLTLMKSMQEYCEMLERFEVVTTIDIYLDAISASHDLSLAFSQMLLKINKPPSVCTLHEIRMLKEALAEKASLCMYSVYIENMAQSSVLLVLRFPPSAVGWVLAALRPDFLHTHHLTEVTVDGQPLTVTQEEKRDLNIQVMDASAAGDVVRVVSLLNSGADVETMNERSETPLDRASWKGNLNTVRLLLGRGAVVDSRDSTGYTPLISAAVEGKCDTVTELLDNRADVNAQTNDGISALIRAARWGHTEVVQKLVKTGANVDLQNDNGKSALMKAARTGHTDVVRELVKAGANLNLQNNRGDSAVIRATVEHESGALQELVSAGADLNLQNEEGLTALMISVRSGRTELTDILLAGDDIDIDIKENSTDWSALFFSAERGDVATTLSLLKAGANTLLKDRNGLTALEVAAASAPSTVPQYDYYDSSEYQNDVEGVCEMLSKHIQTIVATEENTPVSNQDSTGTDQDRSHSNQYSTTTTDETTPTTVSQAIRNAASHSRQRIAKLFNQLKRRLKSANEKIKPKVGGQEGKSTEEEEEKRCVNRPPDN